MPYARRLALATVLAAALAGCGSGSSPTGSGSGGVEVANVPSPLVDARGTTGTPRDYIVKSSDTIYTKKPPRVVSYPTGRDNDEISETGATPINPCSLVPRSEAAAILGGTPQVTQEPQGPTCVYAGKSGTQVTLAIESTRLSSLRGHARGSTRVRVGSKLGWCLRYEATSVAVPLSGGRVLHVTGPCAAARRFAALALPGI